MAENQFVKDPDFLNRLDDIERENGILRAEKKERAARYLRLTYSPGEQVWVGIAVISLIAGWVLLT